jgi:tetratricopeptide (TPR) repeat protein
MARQGRNTEEVIAFVEPAAKRLLERVKDDKQRAAILQGFGRLYASNEMWPSAESWYRKLYAQEPGAFEPLVGVLTQQGRTMEAVQICEEAAKAEDSSRGAAVAVSVLASGKATAKEVQRAEMLITSALERFPKDLRLLFNVATLRVMQGRTDDAAKLFRLVVDINPRHVLALNNLATLLSEQPDQRKEALRLIDRAIEITGSEAALFDTKGTILIFDDQSSKAIEFLKAAVDGPDADPRYRFHLALAYKDVNEIEKARSELEQALQKNLDKQILTPTEQNMLSELRSILTP